MKGLLAFFVFSFLLFSVVTSVRCQNNRMITGKLLENIPEWHEGHVTLTDGSKLTGMVRFDENVGILTYQNGDNSKTLVAKTVTAFDFYDEQVHATRFFLSMKYDDGRSVPDFYFFEILREFDRFAVLAKVDPIQVEVQQHTTGPHVTPYGTMTPGAISSSGKTVIRQTETIFIIDDGGNISPYVRILEKETDGLFGRKRTKNKFADEDLLRVYTGNYYPRLEVFADRNDLDFRVKSQLMQILDHYHELLGSR
jgi:hypothetical protein